MDKSESVFLNGKQQIIDMFRIMGKEQQQKLLQVLKRRSPQLAQMLVQESVTFERIFEFDTQILKNIFASIDPRVIGLAIKNIPKQHQKKALISMDRSRAELAFQTMNSNFSNEVDATKRARNKVMEMTSLFLKNNMLAN